MFPRHPAQRAREAVRVVFTKSGTDNHGLRFFREGCLELDHHLEAVLVLTFFSSCLHCAGLNNLCVLGPDRTPIEFGLLAPCQYLLMAATNIDFTTLLCGADYRASKAIRPVRVLLTFHIAYDDRWLGEGTVEHHLDTH